MATITLDRLPGLFCNEYRSPPNRQQDPELVKAHIKDMLWLDKAESYERMNFWGKMIGSVVFLSIDAMKNPSPLFFSSDTPWTIPVAVAIATFVNRAS